MEAIGLSLGDEDTSEVDHENFMRGVIAKFCPRCFFCNLEGHPRYGQALSGVKARKARLFSEAEARRKEKPQELAKKKMQAVTEEIREPEPVTAADNCKNDYKASARDALYRVQKELVTKEIELELKLELENGKNQERLNAFEASQLEKTKAPSNLSMKLKGISL